MRHPEAHSEWVWMSLIGLFLCLPLTLTIWSRQPDPPALLEWLWERNLTLVGVETKRPAVELSLPNVLKGHYQREYASGFDREFVPRGVFIRLTCELDFQLFRTCALKSAAITVGREGWLFHTDYLKEYCLLRPPRKLMENLVKDLHGLHQQCQDRGVAFAVVVTPSKAAIYPEYLPAAWQARYDQRRRCYGRFVSLLRSSGIPYVDGHQLTLAAKTDAPAPVFPKGGTHWSAYAALITTAAAVEALRKQGKPLSPLRYERLQVLDVPMGTNPVPRTSDADVYNLMNLAIPWHYPIAWPTIKRLPAKEGEKLTVALVGGSFSDSILQQLDASGQFAEINFYRYYNLVKWTFYSGEPRIAALPVTSVDVEREIFGADCLILEVNEEWLPSQHHLNLVCAEARAVADRPLEPKPKFRYESYQEYVLGTDIPLKGKRPLPIDPYLTGFSPAEPDLTWTDGPEATLRLVIQPPDAELVLDADVWAIGGHPLLPEQNAEVFANDIPVGKWRFTKEEIERQKAVIPKEAIGTSGRLVLRFVIAEPRSPRQLGIGADDRQVGLAFSRIRISAAEFQ
jgi:hypothetical protein